MVVTERVFLNMADTQTVEESELEDSREEFGLSSDSVNESMSVEEISFSAPQWDSTSLL